MGSNNFLLYIIENNFRSKFEFKETVHYAAYGQNAPSCDALT